LVERTTTGEVQVYLLAKRTGTAGASVEGWLTVETVHQSSIGWYRGTGA
jgi:hypothetical protein